MEITDATSFPISNRIACGNYLDGSNTDQPVMTGGYMFESSHLCMPETVSIAFETNWRGYLGYLVELPGAYIRGPTEEEAIPKVIPEASAYLGWLGVDAEGGCKVRVVQKHRGIKTVEDADTEILLNADQEELSQDEFQTLINLTRFSAETLDKLYSAVENKDWVNKTAVRETFYGNRPATATAILEHVVQFQFYYLSRMKITDEVVGDFVTVREFCLGKLEKLYGRKENSLIHEIDREQWTLKKVLRRFIWHDRIHGKAMTRLLEKQKQMGVISDYEDCFGFATAILQN